MHQFKVNRSIVENYNRTITASIGEVVTVVGMSLLFYSIYMVVGDYLKLNNVVSDYSSSSYRFNIEDVFSSFEKLVIYTVTKLIPISLVLISAGSLAAKHLLNSVSRIFIVSLSVFIVLINAYFLSGEFELICAVDKSQWLSWSGCMVTIFPVSLLVFTSYLIAFNGKEQLQTA